MRPASRASSGSSRSARRQHERQHQPSRPSTPARSASEASRASAAAAGAADAAQGASRPRPPAGKRRRTAEEGGRGENGGGGGGDGRYPVGKLYRRKYRLVCDAMNDLGYFGILRFSKTGFGHRDAGPIWTNGGMLSEFIDQIDVVSDNLDAFERASRLRLPGAINLSCVLCKEEKKPGTVYPCCCGASTVCTSCLAKCIDKGDDAKFEICLGCMRQALCSRGDLAPTPMCRKCPRSETPCVGDCGRFICKASIAYYTACERPMCRACSILGCVCTCAKCDPKN